MFCTKCQNDLSQCICDDIKERLASLHGNKYVTYKLCKKCGEHYKRCQCKEPEWVLS